MCVIQQDQTNFFLTDGGDWTSDLNEAADFKSIRDAGAFRDERDAMDSHVLMFRDRRIYRINFDEDRRPVAAAL